MNHWIDPKQKFTTPDFRTFYSKSGFSIIRFAGYIDTIQYPSGWYWESLLPDDTLAGDVTGPFRTEANAVIDARKWLSAKDSKSTPWYRILWCWMLLMFLIASTLILIADWSN